jgi:hypothetical protein
VNPGHGRWVPVTRTYIVANGLIYGMVEGVGLMADDDHTRELDISDLFAGRGPRHGATGGQTAGTSAELRVPEQRSPAEPDGPASFGALDAPGDRGVRAYESMTGAQRAAAAIEDAATPAGLSSTFGGPAGSTGSLPLVPAPASGAQHSGAQPSGASPSGSQPPGTQPSGSQPSGTQPSGSQPSGTQPSGGTARGTSSEEITFRVTAVRATGKAKPVPAAQPGIGQSPAARTGDETMILPAFLTGTARKPEPAPEPKPAAPQKPARPDPIAKLPSDERNMLIFVAAVLAIGTLAIVAMAGLHG